MITIRDRYYKHLKTIVYIYILAAVVSCGYVIVTGTYNGDFSGYPATLQPCVLGCILLFTLSPFVYLWKRYTCYKKKNCEPSIPVPISFIKAMALGLMVIRLFIFGICAQNGGRVFDLGWILTILESLNPIIFIYIYFVSSQKKEKFLVIVLLLIDAFFKQSLNIVFSIVCLILFCYFKEIKGFIRKHVILCFFLVLSLPTVIAQLYILRSDLRDNNSVDYSGKAGYEIMCDIVAGRLSSYANACFLIEDAVNSYIYAQSLPSAFFQARICDNYGLHFVSWPDFFPEKYLHVRYQGGSSDALESSTSLMLGIPGVLILSFLKSPWIFLMNLCTILLIIEICFRLTSSLNIPFANELPVLLLLYPMLSGVSVELFFVIIQLLFLRISLFLNQKIYIKK